MRSSIDLSMVVSSCEHQQRLEMLKKRDAVNVVLEMAAMVVVAVVSTSNNGEVEARWRCWSTMEVPEL
ncbi:unnamed protein product [Sphagnum jensenii]|uniref:Uncharacterized protein n=1 Tax=Sphagnum jensenii TaxID=128206 RepID=A0ABP0WM28_9BRYO